MAAAPGHPVLQAVAEHVARYAAVSLSDDPEVVVAERSGAGVWSDVVLAHALAHPAAKVC